MANLEMGIIFFKSTSISVCNLNRNKEAQSEVRMLLQPAASQEKDLQNCQNLGTGSGGTIGFNPD